MSSAPFSDRYHQGDKLASLAQRAGAHLIDWLPLIPGIALWYGGYKAHLWWVIAIGVIGTFPIWFYNRWYRQGRTGQSWGKKAMGLRLVTMHDGNPAGIRKAVLRDLSHYLDLMFFYIGIILMLFDTRRQTLADKIVKTIVISRNG
jgi:uncharacterized RDD family membrane protein YckC